MRESIALVGALMLTLSWSALGDTSAQAEFDSVIHSKADLPHGQLLFETCAACHGNSGQGANDGSVPIIAAQHYRVLAAELVDFRNGKRRNPRMEHFTDQHHLSDVQDIADVATYVSRLPAIRSSQHGNGVDLGHGTKLYARRCSSCHGVAAEGDNLKGYPRLAGQHYQYTVDQMQDGREGRRANFTPEHIRLLQGMTPTDLAGVADYLSRLGP